MRLRDSLLLRLVPVSITSEDRRMNVSRLDGFEKFKILPISPNEESLARATKFCIQPSTFNVLKVHVWLTWAKVVVLHFAMQRTRTECI